MSVSIYSKGGVECVTGSCHIVDINGKKFMVDCGLFQGKRAESDKKNREFDIDTSEIESVILTHAHADHSCRLPLLCKKGFDGKIYATPSTRDLANIVMMDSAKIQQKDIELLKKKRVKNNEDKFKKQPLYNEKDVLKTSKQFKTVPYKKEVNLTDDVSITFFDAGHILGSSFVSMNVKNAIEPKGFFGKIFGKSKKSDMNILFSGDLGRPNRPIIHNPSTDVPAPDYLVLESTYGNRKHESIEFAIDELAEIVNDTVKKGGKLIIPCFAIERTQEVLYYLHLLSDQKRIPKKIPIYVDSPMASNATQVFNIHQECYNEETQNQFLKKGKNPFSFGQLSFVDTMEESKRLDKMPGPMIIISANGMMEEGRVVYHTQAAIEDPNNTILIVGFMAENTLGRKIRDGAKEVSIMEHTYKVNASVRTINAFSAHADYEEMTEWLKLIDTSKLKKIFLVHGEADAQAFLQEHLRKQGYNVEIIKVGKTYKLN